MRLLAMTLRDFRGVDEAELTFAENGITQVEGPNEAGKSSIVEALNLIRSVKATSQAADVRAVRPTHAQADPFVRVELRTGDYHVTYAKTFAGKKGVAELTVHAPVPESHAGDAAHERASAIFAETVDADLWTALQLVQGAPLDQPVLAELTALRHALAESGGESGAGVHDDLMARTEAEYLRYFTPRGRPTGDYARASVDREAARAELDDAAAALRAVDHLVEQHENLFRRREELEGAVDEQRKSAEALSQRSESLDQLRQELIEARAVEQSATQAAQVASAAVRSRTELIAELDEAEGAMLLAEDAVARVRRDLDELTAAADDDDPEDAVARAREASDAAHDAVERGRAREELVRLERRAEEAAEARRRHADLSELLRRQPIDDEVVRELQDAHDAWAAARVRQEAGAPRLRVERLGVHPVTVDGEPSSDDDARVVGPTVVEVDDVVRVTVTPDDSMLERAAETERRATAYAWLRRRYDVADLDDARDRAAQRADLDRRLERAEKDLEAALDGSEAALEARIIALRERAGDAPTDLAAAQADYDRARTRYDETLRTVVARRDERRRADRIAQELRERLVRATTTVEHAADRRDRATTALLTAREEQSDEALTERAAVADERAEWAAVTVAELERDLDDHGAEELAAELAVSRDALASAERRLRAIADELIDLEARLDVHGRDGLRDVVNVAEARCADLDRQWTSLDARARAVRRLRTVLTEHADRARRRYVEPFRAAMTDIGRTVFGPDFDVEIGDGLEIVSRTLDGRTVPFGSLSGGAREQLGVLGRIATARLVSDAGGAPVILDDALGYADPARRDRVIALLNAVAREGRTQIIVLTCDPRRFDRLARDAEVRLS